jgi:MFS transporter, MHS family, metabolite:H+ symporter
VLWSTTNFALYSLASALIFGKIFFPALGDSAATVASFATLAIGFFARPIGGCSSGPWATSSAASGSS